MNKHTCLPSHTTHSKKGSVKVVHCQKKPMFSEVQQTDRLKPQMVQTVQVVQMA
jgi:hypothetical protein